MTREEFLDQTLDPDTFEGIEDTTIDEAIVWASGQADSYIQKRKTLPLLTWGADLKNAVGDMTAYKLLKKRGFQPNSPDTLVVKGYDDAVLWLKDVAKGLAELVDCVDSTPEVDEGGPLAGSDNDRQDFRYFTRGEDC